MRNADESRPTQYLVNHPQKRVGVPSPSFFHLLEQMRAKAEPAMKAAEEVQSMREGVEPIAEQPAASSARPASGVPAQGVREDPVFSRIRASGIAWAETFCPPVASAMNAARDAILRGEVESLAQAGTSLRRALVGVADFVEPPGQGTRPDHTGTHLQVGREQFRNRLYIYLGKRLEGKLQRKLALANLNLVEGQLDAVVRLLNKAIHADGARADLEQLYINTWSVISHVVQCAELPA